MDGDEQCDWEYHEIWSSDLPHRNCATPTHLVPFLAISELSVWQSNMLSIEALRWFCVFPVCSTQRGCNKWNQKSPRMDRICIHTLFKCCKKRNPRSREHHFLVLSALRGHTVEGVHEEIFKWNKAVYRQ